MQDLFGQLGINVKMLLAQIVNFGILLTLLTIFVYRPLMRLVADRRQKIEFGIKGAEVAQEKILAAEAQGAEKIKEADREAVGIISRAQKTAEVKAGDIVSQAQKAGASLVAEAELSIERQKAEEMAKLSQEAEALVKAALIKAVDLRPEEVDDRLIKEAISSLKS